MTLLAASLLGALELLSVVKTAAPIILEISAGDGDCV